jgi:chromosome transmission fidelity protein 4
VFNVVALAWHPTSHTLSFTTSQGQLYRWKECLPSDFPPAYGGVKRAPTSNHRPDQSNDSSTLSRSPSILSRGGDPFGDDDLLDEDDDFVIDDDGAGYVPLAARKRNAEWDDEYPSKRGRGELAGGGSMFRVKTHDPFQSGSTPWRGNRRYLSTPTSFWARLT